MPSTRTLGETAIGRLLAAPVRPGVVLWLGVRSARRDAMDARETIVLSAEAGIDGDHARGAARAVTLIGAGDLAAIAGFLGTGAVPPEAVRRNVVVGGLNLLALKEGTFRLGTARLAMTGPCHPCSRMEERFGPGGYNAVRGHGGITARVLAPGIVAIGDAVLREVDATTPLPMRSLP